MTKELPIAKRLINGSRVLGALYKSGQRCKNDWAGVCEDAPEARSKFCKGKLQWLALAVEDIGRDLSGVEDSFGLIHVMKCSEFEVTGLTMTLDNNVKIGPSGMITATDAGRLSQDPSSIPSVLKILETFPNSKVVKG